MVHSTTEEGVMVRLRVASTVVISGPIGRVVRVLSNAAVTRVGGVSFLLRGTVPVALRRDEV